MDLDALGKHVHRLLAFETAITAAGGIETFIENVTGLLDQLRETKTALEAERAELSEIKNELVVLAAYAPLLEDLQKFKAEFEKDKDQPDEQPKEEPNEKPKEDVKTA